MHAALTRTTERVDEMPRVWAHRERLGLQPLVDEPCPTHGHGVGRSLGWVRVRWLAHRLSEGDHRRHHVAPGAPQRRHPRRECTEQPVHPLDVSDDRLATGLAVVSAETRWSACAGALKRHARRVSDRQSACGRRDRTTAKGHGTVTEDGLGPFGHRQDHRPDLPQVTILGSALEPLGMPVATDVGPGQRADAPWDVPAIPRVRAL